MIPGAIVEDDSSWISWNRVHDFYDDHPYGNNHTWIETLGKLRYYIAAREAKPLALGEAIAADSWTVPTNEVLAHAESSSAHGVWFATANRAWIEAFSEIAKSRDRVFRPDLLEPQSIHYGMLMRKYQIEAFHCQFPTGAYVVSVIRDFPKAAMGLIDFNNQPKNSIEDWAFHGTSMILLLTENDRRSFQSEELFPILLIPKDLSQQHPNSKLNAALIDQHGHLIWSASTAVEANDGMTPVEFKTRMPQVDRPSRFLLQSTWDIGDSTIRNEWPVWVFPSVAPPIKVAVHSSACDFANAHFEQLRLIKDASSKIVFTRKLDQELLSALDRGAKVFMIPDGGSGSFPIYDHWFLRGSVAVMAGADEDWHLPFHVKVAAAANVELNGLVELQHFDLAGPVVSNLGHYQDLIDPLVLLWDNHDQRDVRTHGLAFRMEFGEGGALFVSSLNFVGDSNSAGKWLLHQLLKQLELEHESDLRMNREIRLVTSARLIKELGRKTIELHRDEWQFQPDPTVTGLTDGWYQPDFDDSHWARIRIDRHWEGQGYPDLDHWAWYRTKINLPANWDSSTTYLNVTGIDDYADIYLNGEKVASVGDIEKQETAFDLRRSIDISAHAKANEQIQISIAVYDWFGAGGIFRPISISAHPLADEPPILK
jgi:hypothetical protein